MKMLKKVVSLISTAAVITTSVNISAFADAIPKKHDLHVVTCVAEAQPSEYGYINYKYVDENGNEVESPNLMPSGEPTNQAATLPTKYSLLDKGYVPPVRDQGKKGTCWAHAGMAMAESNMAMQNLASASNVDYSEKHLVWFSEGASAPEGDPLYGDIIGIGSKAYDNGGCEYDIMYTLMAWMGAEQESNVPYKDFDSNVDESYRYHSYAHAQNVNLYDKNDMVSIKNAIMRDGAVDISYCSDNYYNFNKSFTSYYCPFEKEHNHEVTIVGWDDNFSKDNFGYYKPSNDGAWLCRNSWGSYWGTNGYFYLSYEDATIGELASVTMEPTSNYGKTRV